MSPHVGEFVATIGLVTGVKSNGFFIQTRTGPGGRRPQHVGRGLRLHVERASRGSRGRQRGQGHRDGSGVHPVGGSQQPADDRDRRLARASSVLSTGNALPAAVTLTAADTSPGGSIEQLEKYEGMRVHVDTLNVIAPTQGTINEPNATSTSNGVFYGVIPGIARPFREPGVEVPDPLPPGSPCCVPRFDANPERLRVDSDGLVGAAALEVTTGAVVTNLTGPLDYAFRTYTIDPDPAIPSATAATSARLPVPPPIPNEFTVASFNMERFFDTVERPGHGRRVLTPAAFANRLNKASLAIRNVLRYPDILGVEEMENLTTLQAVANKINSDAVAAGDPNPNYQAYLEEGNDIGGIDVGFLVKSSRVNVIDVTQYNKDETYIDPNTGQPALLNDRPPLLLRATVQPPVGRPVPHHGHRQPPPVALRNR